MLSVIKIVWFNEVRMLLIAQKVTTRMHSLLNLECEGSNWYECHAGCLLITWKFHQACTLQ